MTQPGKQSIDYQKHDHLLKCPYSAILFGVTPSLTDNNKSDTGTSNLDNGSFRLRLKLLRKQWTDTNHSVTTASPDTKSNPKWKCLDNGQQISYQPLFIR